MLGIYEKHSLIYEMKFTMQTMINVLFSSPCNASSSPSAYYVAKYTYLIIAKSIGMIMWWALR